MSAIYCRLPNVFLRLSLSGLKQRPAAVMPRARPAHAFASLVICLAAYSIAGICSAAQDYPSRPVRWTIGFPAGGSTDILVRIMSEWLQTRLGQVVLVENKAGA